MGRLLCLTLCLLSWGWKDVPSCACREKGQEPLQLHWLEGVKGSYGGWAWKYPSATTELHPPFSGWRKRVCGLLHSFFVKGKCCQDFLNCLAFFQLYDTVMNIAHLEAIFDLTLLYKHRSIRPILNGIRQDSQKKEKK